MSTTTTQNDKPCMVVTWQSPDGAKINISDRQEKALRAQGRWPRDGKGREYCQVYHGRHMGWEVSDSKLGL